MQSLIDNRFCHLTDLSFSLFYKLEKRPNEIILYRVPQLAENLY